MIVTVTPNPGLDRTIEVARLRRGELHRVSPATVEPGGKGINVARMLAANGVVTEAVFPAGGAEGEALVAMLAHELRARPVAIGAPLRVNVAVVEPGGHVTKLNEDGPELTAADARALLSAVREAARGARWVLSCGSLPRGLPVDFHAHVVAAAHAQGARAAVDASGDAFLAALAAGPDLVKPNRDELEEAVGWPIATYGDAVAAARTLVSEGACQVLASFAGAGAILVDADSALHGFAACKQVQSTVGAGDALLAGFVAGEHPAPQALRQGVEWAAQSVAMPGN
ncbi:MAG: 1-phosphofructokinase, partial [Solirubrobacteraceae bacterium]|nr:1-phosphofructokinase [Solirubrobacteraceae bacterium]